MVRVRKKKGYFFLLDGLIALTILVSGVIIIGSIFVSKPIFKPPYNVGEDLLLLMSSANISSLDLTRNAEIAQLFEDDKITDNESSILQQVGKFFYQFCEGIRADAVEDAHDVINDTIDKIIPKPYYAELNITKDGGCAIGVESHSRIYTNFEPDPNPLILFGGDGLIETSKRESRLLIINQKTVMGNYNQDTIFGPYVVQLAIWR